MNAVLRPAYPALAGHRFYVLMSAACVAVAFLGFAPTYWVPMMTGSLRIAPVFHIHGALFFFWTIFMLLQTSLVAAGRTGMHRELGLAGIALASAMVCTGLLVTVRTLTDGLAAGLGDQARAFSIVSFSAVIVFAAFVAYAVMNVRRPDVHKRAMLIATVSILQAAAARWFIAVLAPPGAVGPPPVAFTIAPGLAVNLLIVAAMVHDWRSRGRPHPVYVGGLLTLLAVQVLRAPVSATAVWLSAADWIAGLAA
jgi:hypothetical protein